MRTLLLAALLSAAIPALAAPAPMDTAAPERPAVLTIDRLFANPPLLGTPPRALTIAPDGRHIAWLQPRADDQLRFDLWVEEIATGQRRMAVDSLALSAAPANLSEAELMRRERARLASVRGIVEYQWSPDGRTLLVPLDGDIWLAPLAGKPRRITATAATEIDARLSPRGKFASFVRDQNMFVVDPATGKERALTRGGGGPISYGVAEFVAQEEMDRLTGQWWAPDDRHIAIARVDESDVQVAVRAAIGSSGTRVSEQRYPFAGTPNAKVSLEIHSLGGGAPVQVDLGKGLDGAANSGPGHPDIYLARVTWLNPKQLVVQRQTRDQKRLDLLLVEADTGMSRLLFSETSDTWVNLHDSLKPLADGRRFLWASERSGQRHIWLWDGAALHQLTRGDWSVDQIKAVDEEGGQILFTGFRESPLEKALYRVSLDGGAPERLTPALAAPERLTPAGAWTEAVTDGRGRAMLLTGSTPASPPAVTLATLEEGQMVAKRAVGTRDMPYAALMGQHLTPEFGTLKAADGVTDLHYALLLPPGLKPGQKVPVFFEVYAGPGVQRVTKQFGSLLHQVLAQAGWAVFRVDNRGTPNRGTAFEGAIYRKLGFPEVDDQMAALAWLKARPFVDPARVAVFGWSYGGYMVQRLMTEHPDAFAAGVSGAPVTDWTLYDTHYTERYLGNPATDKGPYVASDVTLKADRLARPLLIIHGLADDNVVFDHSARMMAALQKAGKPFETMVYPGQTHAIRDPALATHMWKTILAFLERTVKGETAAD
jgi:dipeptidyl-peptidase-4